MYRLRYTQMSVMLGLVLLTACSTTHKSVPSETIDDLTQGSKVSIAHSDPEQFTIWTGQRSAGRVALGMFGAIGGAIEGGLQLADAKEAGAKFISASQLVDPIAQVKDRFLDAWQRELKLPALPASHLVSSERAQKVHEQFGMGYLIDFRTERWSIEPILSGGLSNGPSGYRTTYTGRARLVRLQDRNSVWEGICEYAKDNSLSPSLTAYEITGNDQGTAVKAALQTLAHACADHLWRQFFGREVGPEIPPTTLTEVAK